MTISMFQASIPSLIRGLENLQGTLRKAAEHAETSKVEPTIFTNSRLHPGMLPLRWQVYIATDMAKFAAARLGEMDPPKFEDSQESFTDLLDRVEKTIAFLKTATAEQIDGTDTKAIVIKQRTGDLTLTGEEYLLGFVLPNFYFHTTTAHDILRKDGVPIGKADYLGHG